MFSSQNFVVCLLFSLAYLAYSTLPCDCRAKTLLSLNFWSCFWVDRTILSLFWVWIQKLTWPCGLFLLVLPLEQVREASWVTLLWGFFHNKRRAECTEIDDLSVGPQFFNKFKKERKINKQTTTKTTSTFSVLCPALALLLIYPLSYFIPSVIQSLRDTRCRW